ncbi:MAG: helix-turn-helix transcriptional regulator [Oscillospiraceae bacterium]|nr:helix-turn-helix transcriptional regulator [Oscillospiraceae bacterium]
MFWERFTLLCSERKMKPNRVAAEIGISSASVTKWKRGSIPNSDSLGKIAEYFCVSIDYLLGKTEQKIDDRTWDEYVTKFGTELNSRFNHDFDLLKQIFQEMPREDLLILCDSLIPAIRTFDHTAILKLKNYADDLAQLQMLRIEKDIEEEQRKKENPPTE